MVSSHVFVIVITPTLCPSRSYALVVSQFSNPAFGDDSPDDDKRSAIRQLFSRMMHVDAIEASQAVSQLIARVVSEGLSHTSQEAGAGSSVADIADITGLMARLNADFPGDIGVLCPLILNCVYLSPGQSFFMGADEPHAYVSGDCIECMAPSDNVIRSGLTPKFKDVDVLCDCLTYR